MIKTTRARGMRTACKVHVYTAYSVGERARITVAQWRDDLSNLICLLASQLKARLVAFVVISQASFDVK